MKNISRKNGKKGGRPTSDGKNKVDIPHIEFVILTPEQYALLIKKYGAALMQIALEILENWLKTSPKGYKHRGKNNYAHFRSDGWVINSARMP